jgi:hypothetical protein
VRRSLVRDPATAAFLLAANFQFRRDARRMANAWARNGAAAGVTLPTT